MTLESKVEKGNSVPRFAWILSLAGFIPFGAIAISIFFLGASHPATATVTEYFQIWSAIILSFLGGIRWGLAVAAEPYDQRSLLIFVVPSILGWFAIFLPDLLSVLCLLFLFCAHGAWDSISVNQGKAPVWFGSIRIVLTFLVAAAHLIVAFSID